MGSVSGQPEGRSVAPSLREERGVRRRRRCDEEGFRGTEGPPPGRGRRRRARRLPFAGARPAGDRRALRALPGAQAAGPIAAPLGTYGARRPWWSTTPGGRRARRRRERPGSVTPGAGGHTKHGEGPVVLLCGSRGTRRPCLPTPGADGGPGAGRRMPWAINRRRARRRRPPSSVTRSDWRPRCRRRRSRGRGRRARLGGDSWRPRRSSPRGGVPSRSGSRAGAQRPPGARPRPARAPAAGGRARGRAQPGAAAADDDALPVVPSGQGVNNSIPP